MIGCRGCGEKTLFKRVVICEGCELPQEKCDCGEVL